MAAEVQKNLARESPDILTELKSTSWKPSTSSFDALRFYNEGQQLTQQGIHQDALKKFQAATQTDSNFALGFFGPRPLLRPTGTTTKPERRRSRRCR